MEKQKPCSKPPTSQWQLPTASPFPVGPVRNGYGSAQARPRIAARGVCHTEVHNGWKMLENVGNSIMVGKYWKFIKFIILNLEVPINCPNREFTKFPSFF